MRKEEKEMRTHVWLRRLMRPALCKMGAVMLVLFLSGSVLAAAGPALPGHVPGQVIVKLRPDVHLVDAMDIQQQLNANVASRYKLIAAELWDISGISVAEAIRQFRDDPRIEYIEPNYLWYAIETIPNDTDFAMLWGLHNTGQTGGTADADIDAPEAWSLRNDCSDVVIAVIDTGVDYTHPDLKDNMWTNPGEIPGNGIDDDGNGYVDDVHGWDWVNKDADPKDDHYHGTHCAGTIAGRGNNAGGVAGVCWRAKIMALKFLSASGSGSTDNAVKAVEYATLMKIDHGVNLRLTSNSWGGGGFSQALYDAIEAAGEAGILFVAAAGNNGKDTDASAHYPSSYDLDNIVSVAATDHKDAKASFSNWGKTTVDLGAPGVKIYSTALNGGYRQADGTSMACPHVAGAAALVWARFPQLTAEQVKARLLESVDPVDSMKDRTVSGGRLNLFKAIDSPDSQLKADFTAFYKPYGKWFQDRSTCEDCQVTGWQWNFGDGATSTEKNPVHTYGKEGTFDVSLKVFSNAGDIAEVTKPVTVTGYCTTYGHSQVHEYIAKVGLGSFSKASGPSKYSDFTADAITVYKGRAVELKLTPGYMIGPFPEHWRVWADLNHDGDFTDEGEKLFEGKVTGEAGGLITIPSTAKTGKTRLRVSMSWWSYPGTCGEFYYGEAEDYTLNIRKPIIKVPPAEELPQPIPTPKE
jgi:PKD repeat protein